MNSKHELPKHQEPLANVFFGDVVSIAFYDRRHKAVVLQQVDDEYAHTCEIIASPDGRERLAFGGTSSIGLLFPTNDEPWDFDRILDGMCVTFEINPEDAEGRARVRIALDEML
ncbi:hypothetical protein BH10PAT3_BH10PAT3_0810 [soil metagenome]